MSDTEDFAAYLLELEKARKEGADAERERIAAIVAMGRAKGLEAFAFTLATGGGTVSPETARGIIAVAAEKAPRQSIPRPDQRAANDMIGDYVDPGRAASKAGWDNAIAKANARLNGGEPPDGQRPDQRAAHDTIGDYVDPGRAASKAGWDNAIAKANARLNGGEPPDGQ